MPSPETFNASDTWECPAGVTEVQVECWGGGGGGAASFGGSFYGGGGGAYSKKTLAVVPTTVYAVTVGAGGAGDTGSGSGGTGGDTHFVDNTTVLAKGGSGGDSGGTAGVGGAAASGVGTTKFSGGDGNGGFGDAGGGGSSAGTASDGTDATGSSGAVAPTGGGNGGNAGSPGTAGANPGGGGGGAGQFASGSDGAAGRVVLTYVAAPSSPDAPTSLAAASITATTLTLTWNDESDNETGFVIEKSPANADSWSIVATPAADAESAPITGLSPATLYDFRIKATGEEDDSDWVVLEDVETLEAPELLSGKFQQYNVTPTPREVASIPADVFVAELMAIGGDVRYTMDGSAPSPTRGMVLGHASKSQSFSISDVIAMKFSGLLGAVLVIRFE